MRAGYVPAGQIQELSLLCEKRGYHCTPAMASPKTTEFLLSHILSGRRQESRAVFGLRTI